MEIMSRSTLDPDAVKRVEYPRPTDPKAPVANLAMGLRNAAHTCGRRIMRRSKADAEQTRQKILEAAELLFSEQGVARTTLERIARTAGVTRGAFYWHFKDKAAILSALYERTAAPQLALIKAAAEQESLADPLAFLESTGGDFLALFATDKSQQRMHLIMTNAALSEEIGAWLAELNAELWQVFLRLVRRAEKAGLLTDELTAEEVTVSLMVMFNGLLNEWLRSDKAFDLTRLGPKLLRHHITALRRSDRP